MRDFGRGVRRLLRRRRQRVDVIPVDAYVPGAKMASNGKSVKEITERLLEMRKNTTLFVVVDMLDNLVKGGRVGKGKALIGSLLNIKPIATLQDGVYTPVAKVRSHKQVVSHLF